MASMTEAIPEEVKVLSASITTAAGSSKYQTAVESESATCSNRGPDTRSMRALYRFFGSMKAASTLDRTPQTSPFFSARLENVVKDRRSRASTSELDFEIESSIIHWSDWNPLFKEKKIANENLECFNALKKHPVWGAFFSGYGSGTGWELVLGAKIAEGGQAEIFEANNLVRGSKIDEYDIVAKVFKRGFPLRQLQSQWPLGMLQRSNVLGYWSKNSHTCWVRNGTLLNDGSFAFVLQRRWGDLRKLIDYKVRENKDKQGPPFHRGVYLDIIWQIARGMNNLHKHDVLHRDLKASNVLVSVQGGGDPRDGRNLVCEVADFESSVGVVGTAFWRAPEILKASKKGRGIVKLDTFTKKADVYSYSMTCYEILSGKIPFEGYPSSDYDVIIKGGRPELPQYVDNRLKDLLERCWHPKPLLRPSFDEIEETLLCLITGRFRVFDEGDVNIKGERTFS